MIIFPSAKRARQGRLISFSNVSMLSFFCHFYSLCCCSFLRPTNVHFNVGEPTGDRRSELVSPPRIQSQHETNFVFGSIIIRWINGSGLGDLAADTGAAFHNSNQQKAFLWRFKFSYHESLSFHRFHCPFYARLFSDNEEDFFVQPTDGRDLLSQGSWNVVWVKLKIYFSS